MCCTVCASAGLAAPRLSTSAESSDWGQGTYTAWLEIARPFRHFSGIPDSTAGLKADPCSNGVGSPALRPHLQTKRTSPNCETAALSYPLVEPSSNSRSAVGRVSREATSQILLVVRSANWKFDVKYCPLRFSATLLMDLLKFPGMVLMSHTTPMTSFPSKLR